MNEIILVLTFVLSFFLTLYGTPIAQKVAFRYNILDVPDGKLKKHNTPVPYLGGLIIYFAFITPISLMFNFNKQLLGILFSSAILVVVGLFDDLKALNPSIKFTCQIVATYILIKSGISINLLFVPPWLNATLSFIWILTMINAFNIIDIMDGLAASVGAIISFTFFIISLYNNNYLISILSISLGAALLGFLKFNWEPAKIFLGDAGSMFLGMIIGSLAIMGYYTPYNQLGFITVFLVLGIPLFDLVYVMMLRIQKRKSPFFGSPDHFALRLRKKFSLTSARTVSFIIIFQIILSAIMVINFYTVPTFTLTSAAAILLFFFITGWILKGIKME